MEQGRNETIWFRNSMYPIRHLYVRYMVIPEFEQVTGLVLPNNPELISNDYITVLDLTGDLRFILRSHIVSADLNKNNQKIATKSQKKESQIQEWFVTSKRDKTKEYKVTFRDNFWMCECPGFQFRHSDCNHIQRVKAWSKKLGI